MNSSTSAPRSGVSTRPILDVYLRPGTVNLVVGSGESMHTCLSIQLVRALLDTNHFLDLKGNPPAAVFGLLNESLAPTHEHVMDSMELRDPLVWRSVDESGNRAHILSDLEKFAMSAWEIETRTRLLVLFDLSAIFPSNPNSYSEVKHLCDTLQRTAKLLNCAVLAHVSASKAARRHEYEPRDRVTGSAAWSDCTDAMFILDFPETGDTDRASRNLYITRPGRATRTYKLIWDKGENAFIWLAEANGATRTLTLAEQLTSELVGVEADRVYTRKELFRIVTRNGDIPAAEATLKRWVDDAVID